LINFIENKIENLILDMDGVLWMESESIGNLPAVFAQINNLGLKVILATNNATRSVPQYQDKLAGFGVELAPWQIATSGQAVAFYLQTKYPAGSKVHVVGEAGLIITLEEAGFVLSDDDVKAVIVGVDHSISYGKISTAARLIRIGAEFLGTNPDKTFPTPRGLAPGSGAIIAAVATAAEVEPLFIGKPGNTLIEMALKRLQAAASHTLLVGDRLETDILGAQKTGCKSALVLSGVTLMEQALKWNPAPDFIVPDLSDLVGV
jgi:4-nitrophenyl phosphatase